MDLLCYLHPGWKPLLRPAAATRAWMDATPEAFAYRCLPLNIANAHGWEILNPVPFEASWTGGTGIGDVQLRIPENAPHDVRPVSLFGQAVLTFHIFGIFRTPPSWNLWVGGSPNSPKDGIFPLTGIVETDWAPYTFTMNWRFTRPNHWVRFEENEPICFVFPVQRGYLDKVEPKLVAMESNPALMAEFKAWSASRDAFQAKVAKEPPASATEKWQKRYYRGLDMSDKQAVADHQIKPRLQGFVFADPAPRSEGPPPAIATPPRAIESAATERAPSTRESAAARSPGTVSSPAAGSTQPTNKNAATGDPASIQRALQAVASELMFGAAPEPLVKRLIDLGAPEAEARRIIETAQSDPLIENGRRLAHTLRKRDWLLSTMERHWHMRPGSDKIERRAGLSADEFRDSYYAPSRPVILIGDMADWPALAKWTPDYLKSKVGSKTIEFQGGRKDNPRFEMEKDRHRQEMPFDRFIDSILERGAGNDSYITAYNSRRNAAALAPLEADLGFPSRILERQPSDPQGMMWIGPAGTFTALHHDITDNLIVQVVGRKKLRIAAAADVAKIYNFKYVFSEIADLEAAEADPARYPALKDIRFYDVVLNPGEMIFMPIGWWHQVRSLDFSVTVTYTNFKHGNPWHATFPAD